MSLKLQNSLFLDYDLAGLPVDWRKRAEAAVHSVAAAFDLYVTKVQAGARRSPPGVIISVAREGAEEAWTDQVERLVAARIVAVLDTSKEQEVDRAADRRRMERALVGGYDELEGEIHAVEGNKGLGPGPLFALQAKRRVLTGELRSLLAAADLPPEARAFADAALAGMADAAQWGLWARLLLVVVEVKGGLGPRMCERLESLL